MRNQEKIYTQDNRGVRNKAIVNVNMSSDFCVFKSPKFYVSGATKVQCNSITFSANTDNFLNFAMSSYTDTFGISEINPNCYSQSNWYIKIYEDNIIVDTQKFSEQVIYSGTPSVLSFTNSLNSSFTSLGYDYTLSNNVYTMYKPYGVHDLRIDVGILYNLDGLGVCPSGYTSNINQDGCTKIVTTGATYNGSGTTILHGDTDNNYASYGTYFYPDISKIGPYPLYYTGGTLYNQSGGTVTALNISNSVQNNSFWYNSGNTTDGRLNKIGLSALTGTYVGFSKCLDIASGGTYYIGLASDNDCEFKVNGDLIVYLDNAQFENFKIWNVFPVTLKSGKNIIEMLGKNDGGHSSFGAEVYQPNSYATLTGATTTGSTQANVIFSTLSYVGKTWDIGTSVGYSCPTGFALDVCSGFTCSQIFKTGYTESCGGIATGDTYTSAEGFFPYIDNTSNGVYIFSGNTGSVSVTFDFTGDTSSFITNNALFKYKVYKFNSDLNLFAVPSVYNSQDYNYSTFSGTNQLNLSIPLSELPLDGDFLVKGYYDADACTTYLKALNKGIDTSIYNSSTNFGLYNPDTDFYFVGIKTADIPIITQSPVSGTSSTASFALYQQVFLINTDTPSVSVNGFTRTGSTLTLSSTYVGDVFVTLNGLVMSKDVDYSLSGQVLTFYGSIYVGDIITIVYTRDNSTTIISNSIELNTVVPSGTTNNQGSNKYYFNTTTGKYEIYINNTPIVGSNIVVMLNGITLATNIDFYQSTSNLRRIILEGTIMKGDIINVVYCPQANIINGITQNINIINWIIPSQEALGNGIFTLQYGADKTFTTYSVGNSTPYQPYVTSYSSTLSLTGSAGTTLYYRIENKKQYKSICGDIIESVAYSESVPVVIQNNSINSY